MNWLGFFIGILVGWIVEWLIDFFYWRRKWQSCQEEKEILQLRLNEAEKRLRTFQVKGQDLEAPEVTLPTADLGTALPERHAELPPIAPQAPDDLKLIEGIGPKISQLLKDNGILTFSQLATTSPERLWAILEEAGPRFQLANPESWPEQARLAAGNAWDELRVLQDRLIAGRRTQRWDR